MPKPKLFVGALAASLVGCASPPPAPEPPPVMTCYGEKQCGLMWRTAQAWVSRSSYFPVTIASDAIIQTQRPRGVEAYYAYEVTKRPMGGGLERIDLTLICMNLFGCGEPRDAVRAKFRAELEGATR